MSGLQYSGHHSNYTSNDNEFIFFHHKKHRSRRHLIKNSAFSANSAKNFKSANVDTLEDFEDLILLFTLLKRKKVNGNRIAALSNAGAEVVCCADHKGFFQFSNFTKETSEALLRIFTNNGFHTLVDLHNPLDLTPMANDDVYGLCSRTIVDDPNVDLLLVGIVPFTPSLKTLEKDSTHPENFLDEGSVVMHLEKLQRVSTKPLVCVVDGGKPYDPMVEYLMNTSISTFRSADRAIRLFNTFCHKRLNG